MLLLWNLYLALNEKLSNLFLYSFASVLDCILDAFENDKTSAQCDEAPSEIDDEVVLQELLWIPRELIDLEISLSFASFPLLFFLKRGIFVNL